MAAHAKSIDRAELSVSRPELLTQRGDEDFRQLVQDLFGAAARMQALRDRLGEIIGISGPQYSILIAVQHLRPHADGVTVKRLSQHLHVSGTYVTAETNKLAQAGLLRKVANPGDARSVHLEVTQKGMTLLRRLLPLLRRLNDGIFADFDRTGFQVFCRRTHGLVATLDSALEDIRNVPRGNVQKLALKLS